MRAAAKILGLTVSALMLTGCTTALEPAAPKKETVSTAPSQNTEVTENEAAENTAAIPVGLTPAESGLERTWSMALESTPEQIAVSEQRDFVVILLQKQLVAFRLVNETNLLEQWRFNIENGQVENLLIGGDQVYFNISGERPDLQAVNLRSGDQTFSWHKMHSLDTEVPQIVGFYQRGLGVIKQGRNSFTAAILNSHGESVVDKTLYQQNETKTVIETNFPNSLVASGIVENGFQQFIFFPSLEVISASNCFSLVQGAVCTRLNNLTQTDSVDDSADQTAELNQNSASSGSVDASPNSEILGEVIEYDQFGQLQQTHDVRANSAVLQRTFLGGLPELTPDQLATALVAEQSSARAEDVSLDQRVPSYLYGAEWFSISAKTASLTNDDAQTCVLINRAAPLCITDAQIPQIKTLQDGRILNSPDATAILGVRNNEVEFFEYAEGKIFGLTPKKSS